MEKILIYVSFNNKEYTLIRSQVSKLLNDSAELLINIGTEAEPCTLSRREFEQALESETCTFKYGNYE